MIFFADEGGAWQVGVNWAKVFPAWFRCLARTAAPQEFAQAVLEAVNHFAAVDRDKHFATAKELGTPDQRRALAEAIEAKQGRR